MAPEALFCLGAALFIGSFKYVKIWISVGNPLGYLEASLGSWKIFTGNRTPADYNKTTLWSIFAVTSRADWRVTGWMGPAMRFAFPFITMLTILAAQSIQYLVVPAWIIEIFGALLITNAKAITMV